jgi:transcription elongation GreA/GreB family factor
VWAGAAKYARWVSQDFDLRTLDKAQLIAELQRLLANELQLATRSQQNALEGATHEEAKPENDKDTRATEASYLARGQAARVEELQKTHATWSALRARPFGPTDPIAVGALVALEDDEQTELYLVVPAGAGFAVETALGKLRTVTAGSPIGKALIGKHEGDDIQVRVPGGERDLNVRQIA